MSRLLSEGVLARVGDVQEAVLVLRMLETEEQEDGGTCLVLLVYGAHQRGGGRQHLVDEDEDGLLRRQLDALADDVDELADGQVGGDEVLLLVDGGDVRLFDLLADDLSLLGMRLLEGGARTGMRSAYFWRMRSASALRFSKGCSSLNLECMVGRQRTVGAELRSEEWRRGWMWDGLV
jgi:hypothetical protein